MCGPLTGPQPQLQPGRAILNGPDHGVFNRQECVDGRAVAVASLRRDAAHSIHMLSGTQTVCDPAARRARNGDTVTQYEVFGVCGVRFPGYFNGV